MLTWVQGWEKSKLRHQAWWQGEVVDRVLIQVFAPKKKASADKLVGEETEGEKLWLDPGHRLAEMEKSLETFYYAGDAFPYLNTSLGPGTFSLFLGARPEFKPNTVWYHPCYQNIATASLPVFDEQNKYWQATISLCTAAVKHSQGRYLVAYPDLIENLDTLASLFGTEQLLHGLIDYPEKIHQFQTTILPIYLDCHRRIYEIIKDQQGGSCFSHFSVYGYGRIAKLQCDFSAMISPRMFEEFVLPYLDQQCQALDHTVYHWDGPGALQHEKFLLSLRSLQAVQWTPGAGQPGVGEEKWWPLYRRVRQAGKSLLLMGVTARQAERLVEYLGPEGLNFLVSADTPEQADQIVRQAASWQKKRLW
ncbi:MAG: hypothetical protein NC911_01800 [Candidatus Omnitrophica bacterium]|nr:hypothetical protein [Candidatus Omnitrophota bacterium]